MFFLFFVSKKGFSAYIKNTFSLPSLFMHDLRVNYFLSLNKPGTTSYGLSSLFLTYQLSCGMRYLMLSVPMSLLVLKENPGHR